VVYDTGRFCYVPPDGSGVGGGWGVEASETRGWQGRGFVQGYSRVLWKDSKVDGEAQEKSPRRIGYGVGVLLS
jgi:hypothetical protein